MRKKHPGNKKTTDQNQFPKQAIYRMGISFYYVYSVLYEDFFK